ncbi:hypothetical protein [Pedobacter hiemivivus]|nr:hypothetical protein [Pedobacter hiemivivus]
MKQRENKGILLVSIEDVGLSANQNCWEAESSMECDLTKKHRFINSAKPL